MSPSASNPFVRKVFLDTQVFKTNNFNFDTKSFQLLKELSNSDRVKIFITDVVEREVRARMRREVAEAQAWYNRLRQDARILLSAKDSPFYSLPKKLDANAIADSLEASFDAFLSEADVEVIDCSTVSVGKILDNYFDLSPPFKEGEKRKEFPDAISIEAVAQKFVETDGIFVISADGGVCEACAGQNRLFPLTSIEEFLALELADHEDVSWISAALTNHEEAIKSVISEAFTDGYFYLDDEEGEVKHVEVEEIVVNDMNLIATSEDDAEIAVVCQITFVADISYDDPNMTVYDEGEKYSFGTIRARLTRKISDTFSVSFGLDRKNKVISGFYSFDTQQRSLSVSPD